MNLLPIRYWSPEGEKARASPGTFDVDLNPTLYGQLGDALAERGRAKEAVDAYRRSLSLHPDATVSKRLGILLRELGRFDDAVEALREALATLPEAHGYNALGLVLMETNKLDEAIVAFQTGLRLENLPYINFNLGNAYKRLGRHSEASQAYEAAIALQPDYELPRFGILMDQLRIVHETVEEIQQRRDNYERTLNDLAARYRAAGEEKRARVAQSVEMPTPFLLPYHGRNDRELQKTYGELVHGLMRAGYPQWTTPRPVPPPGPNGKLRLGLISSSFYGHTVWKLMLRGWLQSLDRDRFEVFCYHTGRRRDVATTWAVQNSDKFVQGPFRIEEWAQRIDADQLHAIIFPEIGIHAWTMGIASLRLAPVQMACWGHPETTGLPTVDCFLSSDLMEPADGQDWYTERLVRLPNLGIHYVPLTVKPAGLTRQDIAGLAGQDISVAADETLFICCQSLFKYLPQHDDVFPRIAKEVGPSKFIFIRERDSQHATETFFRRLEASFGSMGRDYRDHCVLLPRLTLPQFLAVCAASDVFLDSVGWSGGNTSLETIAFNVPLVTWPGEAMRGRHTMAFLRRMGIEEMIAGSKDEFIQIAARLGREPAFRAQMSERIAANKHKLYRDEAPVRALEDLILREVETALGAA
ncbi:MAG: tetratricopeptide repeat protein [Alphaproteobacteria bacterium]|nr:tetratricopeptide repeat protein [Alphaproteobacteria bacterium]